MPIRNRLHERIGRLHRPGREAADAVAREPGAPGGGADGHEAWLKMLPWGELVELMHLLNDAFAGDPIAQQSLEPLARLALRPPLDLRVPLIDERARLDALRLIVQSELRERISERPAGA